MKNKAKNIIVLTVILILVSCNTINNHAFRTERYQTYAFTVTKPFVVVLEDLETMNDYWESINGNRNILGYKTVSNGVAVLHLPFCGQYGTNNRPLPCSDYMSVEIHEMWHLSDLGGMWHDNYPVWEVK